MTASRERATNVSKGTKVLIAIAALGWGLLALYYGWGVIELYEVGYSPLFDFVVPGVALVAFAVSIGAPIILSRSGRTKSASAVAVFSVVALLAAVILSLLSIPA